MCELPRRKLPAGPVLMFISKHRGLSEELKNWILPHDWPEICSCILLHSFLLSLSRGIKQSTRTRMTVRRTCANWFQRLGGGKKNLSKLTTPRKSTLTLTCPPSPHPPSAPVTSCRGQRSHGVRSEVMLKAEYVSAVKGWRGRVHVLVHMGGYAGGGGEGNGSFANGTQGVQNDRKLDGMKPGPFHSYYIYI